MSDNISSSFLDDILFPEDLKKISKQDLPKVCNELRNFIVDTVSLHGGHFAASLGVVELTTALHYVYNTPKDLLVWDVGHQAYVHKILTGRKKIFHTNRKQGGISGFPKISESEYDAFGVGHSSTSISSALGMAMAIKQKNENKKVVAIIGDGSMTAGMAFEAMNHAGVSKQDLLIILNDNGIGIDPNVGALNEYLTSITSSHIYNKVKSEIWNTINKAPIGKKLLLNIASKLDSSIKSFVNKNSNLFESLNIRYFGPIDGHNIINLVDVLNDLKELPGVKLLHVITVKGKGYKWAEEEQTKWHAPGLFDKNTGEILKSLETKKMPPKYQEVFGYTILELAKINSKIVGITPAMPSGSSLKIMMDIMPERAIDVGICEQHAVTLSAGMATQGLKVFCNIYSSFMQRAYDQIIHDVAIQKLPVIFCLDRGGLVGEDGATHHGAYDIAYLRCIPNIIVSAPMNETELRNLMFTAQLEENNLPFSIRYPRGNGVLVDWIKPFEKIQIGKGRIINEGDKIAILSIGTVGNFVIDACKKLKEENINPSHYDMRFVKPLDENLLHKIFKKYKYIITIEDGCIKGGFGSAILEFMVDNNFSAKIKMLGIPDKIIEHGTPNQLHIECKYDTESIIEAVKALNN